jgi:hypothetical protein
VKEGMDVVKRHFRSQVRSGVVPSERDLAKFVKSKKLLVKARELRDIRRKFKFTSVFERIKARPRAFAKNSHSKYGQVQVDLGFYRERWKNFNGGARGNEDAREESL